MIPPQNPSNQSNPQTREQNAERVSEQKTRPPGDLLEEERALERELNHYFSLEREELPPLYIQTMLSEHGGDWMIPPKLEDRLTDRVFQTLQLPRQSFISRPVKPHKKTYRYQHLRYLPRALGIGAAFVAGMMALLTILAPLAQQISQLVSQAGFSGYEGGSLSSLALTQYLSPRQTQAAVNFPVYWLGKSPVNYTYESLLLHMSQSWSDGPVVELQYGHTDAHIGYGRLTIYEFRPAGGKTALEVVAPHAVERTMVGNQPGVIVHGHWTYQNGDLLWDSGTQVQLFYQVDDIVFWFIADQRDAATPKAFLHLTSLLRELYLGMPNPHLPELPQPPRAIVAEPLMPAAVGELIDQVPVGTSSDRSSMVYLALGQPPDGSRGAANMLSP